MQSGSEGFAMSQKLKTIPEPRRFGIAVPCFACDEMVTAPCERADCIMAAAQRSYDEERPVKTTG
jgi:hypothetical protein